MCREGWLKNVLLNQVFEDSCWTCISQCTKHSKTMKTIGRHLLSSEEPMLFWTGQPGVHRDRLRLPLGRRDFAEFSQHGGG